MNPDILTHQVTAATRLSHVSVLKLNKFHLSKIHILHELGGDDLDRRIKFRELFIQKIVNEPRTLNNICLITLTSEMSVTEVVKIPMLLNISPENKCLNRNSRQYNHGAVVY